MSNIIVRAESARKNKKLNLAKQLYEKVLETEPENIVALEGLAECFYSLGNLEGALSICIKALEIDTTLLFPHIIPAYIYDDLGDKNKSRIEAQAALNLKPDSPDALCCYGIILMLNKEFDDAIIYFERSTKTDPNMYLAHYNLSVCYYNTRDFKNHYRQAKTLFQLKPNFRSFFRLFGSVLSTNSLLRVSIFLVPIFLYIVNLKFFLAIHGLMIFAYFATIVSLYRNKEMSQFKTTLNMMLFYIFVDAILLITNP